MASTLGIQRATVVSTQDPAGKNRLRLKIPQLLGDSVTEWVEPSIPGGIIPAPGTTVWVLFQGGDVSRPVYLSGASVDLSLYALDSTVVHKSGTEVITGVKDFAGSPARFNTQITLYGSNYGAMWRTDATNTYLLLTNNGDPNGTWNSIRPFYVVNANGRVNMEAGLTVTGGLTSGGQNVVVTTDSRLSDTRTPSNDGNLVHKTGTETIGGAKDFTTKPTYASAALLVAADLPIDSAVGTGSMRTLGNGTLQAAAGATVFNHETRIGTLENNGVYNGNLIYNGDLEAWDAGNVQASGWNNFWVVGTPATVKDTSVFYQGNSSWKVTVSSTSDLQRLGSPEFRVNPGDYIVIKYRMRGSATTARHDCQLLTNDPSNNPDIFAPGLSSQGSASMYPGTINTWEQRTVAFTVPATHTRAKVYFNFQPDAAGAHNYWLDAVSVTIPGPPPTVGSTAWIAPTMTGGWGNYGGSWEPAGYKKVSGIVFLRGLIAGGTATPGTVFFTLPVGMRPDSDKHVIVATGTPGWAFINIMADGRVMTNNSISSSWVSLANISFPADA